MYRSHVLVCGGTGCTSSNSLKIIERFEELIEKNGLGEEVKVVRTGCFGLCERGPIVIVYPEGAFYARLFRTLSITRPRTDRFITPL